MSKLSLSILLTIAACTAHAAQLTETETRWLKAGAPVLAYAKELKLPIDIVVQPQAGPERRAAGHGLQGWPLQTGADDARQPGCGSGAEQCPG
ncbi:hypothetical protein ACHMW6_27915 [Pseudoduganella sp. UC29_106]|uniref:hypothetical protein n=1 Tax=Pseudoduganella sp. UC29_106 TaxID=3374553 RepID=UPI003756D613